MRVGIQRKGLTPKMAVFEPKTSHKQFLPEKKQEIIMRQKKHTYILKNLAQLCLTKTVFLIILPQVLFTASYGFLLKSSWNKKDLDDVTADPFFVCVFCCWQLRKRYQQRGSCDVIKVLLISWQLYRQRLKKIMINIHSFLRCSTL